MTGNQIVFLRGLVDGPCFLSASERGDSQIGRLIERGLVEVEKVVVVCDRAAGTAIPIARLTDKGRRAWTGGA